MKNFVLLSVGLMSMSVVMSGVRPVLADTTYPAEVVSSSEKLAFQWETHVFAYNTDGSKEELEVKSIDAEKRVRIGDVEKPTPVLGYQLLSTDPVKVLKREGDFAKARRDVAYKKALVTLKFVDNSGNEIVKPLVLDRGTVNGRIVLPEIAKISGYTLSNEAELPTKITKTDMKLTLVYSKDKSESKPEVELPKEEVKPDVEDHNKENPAADVDEPKVKDEGSQAGDDVQTKEEGTGTDLKPDTKEEGTGTDLKPDTKEEGTGTDLKPDTKEEGTGTDLKPDTKEEGTGVDLKPDTKEEGTGADLKPDTKEEGTDAELLPESKDEGTQIGSNKESKDSESQTESEKNVVTKDNSSQTDLVNSNIVTNVKNDYPYQIIGKTTGGQTLFTETINQNNQTKLLNTDIKGYHVVGSELVNGNLTLFFAPKSVFVIVTSIDEKGSILRQDKSSMVFGDRFKYVPANILGYRVLDAEIDKIIDEQGIIEYTVHYQSKNTRQSKKATKKQSSKRVVKANRHKKGKPKSTSHKRAVKKNRSKKITKNKLIKKGGHHRVRSVHRHK
ncbi:hypothetical protein PL11_008005 [Lentilactobacillus curieae]|uniref:MucBP domain-containing protein n=1 Tax=Lentilactobacillus curieae TaxID=1138822 RepID=A0A1S6QJT8_9LACO|nr:MucBP domain-containing protein [Lentilactobacillus curieae]AQW21864.1 hypothetical protein PL11_008005 [Lentilactobacillus curieae]